MSPRSLPWSLFKIVPHFCPLSIMPKIIHFFRLKSCFVLYFGGTGAWTLVSTRHSWKRLELCLQFILLWLFWRWDLTNYLPSLTSSCNPPNVNLPSRVIGMSYWHPAKLWVLIGHMFVIDLPSWIWTAKGEITWTSGVAQMIEHLPSKREALSSNPNIAKNQREITMPQHLHSPEHHSKWSVNIC
jgi:hypothetical protein